MSVLSHSWFCQMNPFLERSMARCLDSLAPVTEWLHWLTLYKHEKDKHFPSSLESPYMEKEEQDVCEVLEKKTEISRELSGRGKSGTLNFLLLYPQIHWS